MVATFSKSTHYIPAKDSITWKEAVASAFFIYSGSRKGRRYQDPITELLGEQVPQYKQSGR